MNKRDLLETFINLLPKANTLSEDCDEWGGITITTGVAGQPDWLYDYHCWHDEDIKMYIYQIVDGERVCDEKFIYNKTTDKIELCMFTENEMSLLIDAAKKHMYKDISNNVYQIGYWADENRGFFEHHELGDGSAGELLFDKDKQLNDFDRTMCLPVEVAEALIANGNLTKEKSYDFTSQNPPIDGTLSMTLSKENANIIRETTEDEIVIDDDTYYIWNGELYATKSEDGYGKPVEIQIEPEVKLITKQYVKDKNLSDDEKNELIERIVGVNADLLKLVEDSVGISKKMSEAIIAITQG